MDYTNEKSKIDLDVIVLTPEEFETFNNIFLKALLARTPRVQKEYIKPIDRMILTDSLNSIEFIIKSVKENAEFEKNEENHHDQVEKEYQEEKKEKYKNS